MKNKKGFLLAEETLKMVIAVICIGFLIAFLFALYFNNVNQAKFIQAESVLKSNSEGSIKTAIENLENEKQIYIPNPAGWYLFSFTEKEKPNSCLGNCLCICDNVIDLFDRQIKECDDSGVCLTVNNLKEFEEIKIEKDITKILIKKQGEYLEITKK